MERRRNAVNMKESWNKSMKKFSLMIAEQNVNSACLFWFYQDKVPNSVWKLKKIK